MSPFFCGGGICVLNTAVQYCFHHIPKTAGSSLQLRLAHREHIGQLPRGSTMVVYPLYGDMQYYRVSEDAEFDASKPIKEAFLRTFDKTKVLWQCIYSLWALHNCASRRQTLHLVEGTIEKRRVSLQL